MKVTGSLTGTGAGTAFDPELNTTQFNLTLSGTFSATIVLERKFADDATWYPLTALGNAISFTGPLSETFEECEPGVQYRVHCTAYTSGTINYRLSD